MPALPLFSLGVQNGHSKRLVHLRRSECLNSAMITQQMLHKPTCAARTRVKAAATTSTTPPEMCCRSSPKRAFRNVVQQPGDPQRTECSAETHRHVIQPTRTHPGPSPWRRARGVRRDARCPGQPGRPAGRA
jgi:hypothetical protein